MSRVARWLARLLWGHMLWTMRRPFIRTVRRSTAKRFGSWESVKRQDRFARRHGLPLLTAMLTLLVASMVLTAMFLAAVWMSEEGLFARPALRD